MESQKNYTGILMVRGKGTGFVSHEDFMDDIVIPRDDLSFALNGDVVEIELKRPRDLPAQAGGERREGKIVKVLEPAHTEFIGTVKERPAQQSAHVDSKAGKDEGGYYFSPDNYRIHIRPELPKATPADLGMKIVVKITKWTDPLKEPIGEIVELLGKSGDHETEMQAIIRGGGFSEQFTPPVAEAAQELYKNKEQIFKDAIEDPKRRDFRSVPTMTIDPVDAKDFDDALSLQTLESGNYEVGIHIADVSHYVREGDIIDEEARDRGTSIYLVDRVIPMLPEVLSNDLCSLRPGEDRLAFSAVFEITPEAKVVNEWYGQTIIHSDKRFAYEEAQEVLDLPAPQSEAARQAGNNNGPHLSELTVLMELSRTLRKKRYKQGAIAFDQPEVKFELDENGKPVRAYTKMRTETMLMIEDFMLLANQSVATHIYKLSKDKGRDMAFVYRIHDVPDPEKIEELAIFLHALGYSFETDNGMVKPTNINKLLREIEGKPEEGLIKTATIRSMAKAVYSTKNIGHYGLAFKFYTHFTSPIRRYPDLMVHRLLRRHLDNSPISGKEYARYEKISVQSSEREMEAVKAERDSIKYKQVEFMQDKIGQEFNGTVTGVSDWGIYVEENDSKAEGMVKLSSIVGDYFLHEASKYRVRGDKSGRTYSLGDQVRIKLTRADLEERQLDYEIL